jgi:hypothetical protein
MTKDDAIKAIEAIPPEWARKGSHAKYNMITIEQAVNAIRALPDAGWRDISEAPLDAMILAHADGMVRLVMWEAGRWVQVGKTIEPGWFEPLHWMPLPPPPEKA